MSDFNTTGAFQGAIGGAGMGSFAGPPGMIVGGLLGGLAGGLGGDPKAEYREQLKRMAQGYGGRRAPQAGGSTLLRNRRGLVAQLEAMARGEGPSAAAIQMRDAMDRAAGSQASAAAGAGGRGVNAGAALRGAMNNTAAIQAQGARDTATIRAQEQANATGMLSNTIGSGIVADNALSEANMLARLQQTQLNDDAELRAITSAMGGAPLGLGTQLMAGGAMAMVPGLQHYMAQKGQPAPVGGGDAAYQQGIGMMKNMFMGGPKAGPSPDTQIDTILGNSFYDDPMAQRQAPQATAYPPYPQQWNQFVDDGRAAGYAGWGQTRRAGY